MSFHARPTPPPPRTPAGPLDPTRPRVQVTWPGAEPIEPAPRAPDPAPPAATARPPERPSTTENAEPRAWYRREPWAAVTLSAFVPIVAAFALPEGVRVALLALSALLLVLGVVLLARQGLFRERESPTTGRGARVPG